MPVTKAHIKATQKYEKENYFKSLVRFKKEDEKRIRAAAGKSLNGFIVSAVMDKVKEFESQNDSNIKKCPF